ncbi:MAG: hypothetical protein VB027_11790 [Gordonibacter sp.]|nr:hypothetical protein [Gordonibacter sp.]
MSRSLQECIATSRITSTSGESIAEVLVGILIVGLATVLFATMINVATTTSITSADRTTATYEQISDMATTVASTGTTTITMQADSAASNDLAFPITTSFTVNTYVSSGDGKYTFTRYLLDPTLGRS